MKRRPMPDLDPEYVRSGTRALVALVLVGVVVVAMAAVPVYVGSRIAAVSAEITDVLQPSLERPRKWSGQSA